jgi:hypothetical protein
MEKYILNQQQKFQIRNHTKNTTIIQTIINKNKNSTKHPKNTDKTYQRHSSNAKGKSL